MCSSREKPVTVVMISNNVEEALLLADRIIPLTRGPKATLGAGVAVPLPRPREMSQLMHDEAAERVRADVVQALTGANGPAGLGRGSRSRTGVAADNPAVLATAMEGK